VLSKIKLLFGLSVCSTLYLNLSSLSALSHLGLSHPTYYFRSFIIEIPLSCVLFPLSHLPRSTTVDLSDVGEQLAIEKVAADGHLQLVKRVFHDVVAVHIISAPDAYVDIGLHRVGEEQELGTRQRVEALQSKVL